MGEKEGREARKKMGGWKAWGMGNEDQRGQRTRRENNNGSLRWT